MLYRDGTTAQAGDLVIGKLPDSEKPITGEVICLEAESGHLQIAQPKVQAIGPNQDLPQRGLHFGPSNEPYGVNAEIAQAPAEHFDLLWRAEPPAAAEGGSQEPAKAGKKAASKKGAEPSASAEGTY